MAKVKRRAATSNLESAVWLWWKDAVIRGSQLNYGNYQRSIDFRGTGPWFNKVSGDALFQDFIISRRCPTLDVQKGSFMYWLRMATGGLEAVQREIYIRNSAGRVVDVRSIRFYKFEPRAYYLWRLH